MKRSEINQALKEMEAMASKCGFQIPPFCNFTPQEWEEKDVYKRQDQDALIIRFHEYTGSRQKVTLTPGFAYKSWTESDLRERPLGEECTGAIELELHPYEVKTIMLSL